MPDINLLIYKKRTNILKVSLFFIFLQELNKEFETKQCYME